MYTTNNYETQSQTKGTLPLGFFWWLALHTESNRERYTFNTYKCRVWVAARIYVLVKNCLNFSHEIYYAIEFLAIAVNVLWKSDGGCTLLYWFCCTPQTRIACFANRSHIFSFLFGRFVVVLLSAHMHMNIVWFFFFYVCMYGLVANINKTFGLCQALIFLTHLTVRCVHFDMSLWTESNLSNQTNSSVKSDRLQQISFASSFSTLFLICKKLYEQTKLLIRRTIYK